MLRSILFFSMTLAALAQTPTVTSVVNIRSGPQLSPGAVANILGTGFGEDFFTSAVDGPVNITVSVGGKPAYVTFVAGGGTQVNVQIPVDAPTGTVPLTVSVGGVASAPVNITLDPYAPVLFGSLNVTTGVYPGPEYPAKPGDTVVLDASGLGPTTPPTPTGLAAKANPTAVKPSLTVGGVAANVLYSFISAGSAGYTR